MHFYVRALIGIQTYLSCFVHVALVLGHVWDNVLLNTCTVKSVFTCFGIIFSQLVWPASGEHHVAVDVF